MGNEVAISESSVGEGSGVSVGNAVGLGVSVGGTGVAVGMACCVWATMVKAAASAVCWMSNGLTVGVVWVAQALASRLNTTPIINAFRFIASHFPLGLVES